MAYSHPCICLAFDVFVIHALLGELLFREDKEKKKKDTPTTSTDYLCSTVAILNGWISQSYVAQVIQKLRTVKSINLKER